ncbi:MAG: cyclic nucleotide-binding domain-containing protein [Sphingomonadaceae bacterium]|nr:cyclic nucleotide-binding domain-containing protein [Sphingomonadaceae bacterium]
MDWLIHLAGALLVASMVMTGLRPLRMLALAAGLAALAWAVLGGAGWVVILWTGLFVLANAVQLAIMVQRGRTGDLRAEERELLGHVLGVEEPSGQRRLLDLMRWRDVAPGEVLIREGQGEPPLVYVATGAGQVRVGDRTVGACGSGDFLGEMSLVSGQRATASVIAESAMRVAVFDRDALRQLSSSAPELGSVIAKAINQSLAAKVVRMNRAGEVDFGGGAGEA